MHKPASPVDILQWRLVEPVTQVIVPIRGLPIGDHGGVGWPQDGRDRQAVLSGEVQIALIVRRTAENRARAVLHQHEIGDMTGKIVSAKKGAGPVRPCPFRASRPSRLLLPMYPAPALFDMKRSTSGFSSAMASASGWSGDTARKLAPNRVSGRVVKTFQRLVPAVKREQDLRADRPADPVFLHQPHPVWPAVQAVQCGLQLVGEGGDLQEPLVQLAPFDQRAGAPAPPVDHLFVGQNRIVDRVPIDPAVLAINEALSHEVQEHRLLCR